MARPFNPPHLHRIEIKVRLLDATLAKLDLISLDPFTSKITPGARNTHLENALEDYFEKYYPQRKETL